MKRKPKITFGPPEIRILIEEAMSKSSKSFDVAVQFCAVCLTLFYTAARPGSFFITPEYKLDYAKIRDLRITRRRSDHLVDPVTNRKATVGFDVVISIKTFKGYHSEQALDVNFKVRTVKARKNLVFDVGSYLVASFWRRGLLEDMTVEEVWRSPEDGVRIKAEALDEPLFLCSTRAGFGLGEGPQTDSGFRQMLNRICKRAGLAQEWVGVASISGYCFRRAMATLLLKAIGTEAAQVGINRSRALNGCTY